MHRLKNFEDIVALLTKEKVLLQAQVITGTQERCELERVACALRKETSKVAEERNELEIMLGESDAYGKTLREHCEELEVLELAL